MHPLDPALTTTPQHRRASDALGASILIGVPLLGYANGLGFGVNVTLGASLLAMAVYALLPVAWSTRHPVGESSVAVVVFAAACSLSVLMSLPALGSVPIAYAMHTLVLIVLCPLAFFVGRRFALTSNGPSMARLFRVSLALAVLFVVARLLWPDIISDDEIGKGSYYQYVGDTLAMAALLAYASGDRARFHWPWLLVLPLLVLVGSRASFAAYGTALLVTTMWRPVLLLGAGSAGAIVALGDRLAELVPDFYEVSRVVTSLAITLIEGHEDASLGERRDFNAQALATIAEKPFLGRYGYDWILNGYVGGHAHSAIDVWAQFGVLALLAFVAAVTLSPLSYLVARLARRSPVDEGRQFALLPMLLFLVILFAFFRHPESVPLFFGIGTLAGLSVIGRSRLIRE